MLEFILTLTASVAGNMITYCIAKWLDRAKKQQSAKRQ